MWIFSKPIDLKILKNSFVFFIVIFLSIFKIIMSSLFNRKLLISLTDIFSSLIFNKPSIYSKPFAIIKKGRLCKIHKCKNDWCKISVEKYKGCVKKDILWGLL